MSTLSHAEFNEALSALGNRPGSVPHSVQDGGTYGPTDSLPAPQIPGSRRDAAPRPPTPDPVGVLGAFRDATCGAYALAPATVCRNLSVNPNLTLLGLADSSSSWRNRCHGTLQRFCGGAPPSLQPPSPDAPTIPGGQCEGVEYRVIIEVVRYGAQCVRISNSTGSVVVWGPVLDVRLTPILGSENFASQRLEVLAYGSGGTAPGALEWVDAGVRQNIGPECPYGVIDLINTERVDGLPDDCGDGEPRYPDDPNNPPNVNIQINIGGPGPVTIAPPIQIGPNGISVDLPSIGPVTVDVGGITINPPPPPSPSPPPPPRPEPGDTAPDPSDPPPPPPPPDDPAVEEPAEQGERVIRAVLVTVSNITPAQGVIFQGDNPDVIVPDAGLVSFRIRVDDNTSGWTEDIRVKSRRHFITCPWDGGAFEVKGTARPGVTWDLTPVYSTSSLEIS